MIQTIFGYPVVVLHPNDLEKLFSKKTRDEMINHLIRPENTYHPYARGGKICTTDLNLAVNADKFNQLIPLLDFLKDIGLQFSYLFTEDKIKDLEFDNTWMNLTFKGCEIKNHYDKYRDTNFKSLIILYYPKAETGGSNLVFIHNSKYGQWPSECSDSDTIKISIEEGNVVIFDNSILHAVDAHKLSEPRMCVAAEFKFLRE
jgi:hypothetical protein